MAGSSGLARAALGAALLLGALQAQAEDRGTPVGGRQLFDIPLQFDGPAPLPAGAPLRIRVYAKDVVRLARLLREAPPPAGATSLEYTVSDYPTLDFASARTWLEPTWVIDYDEPDVVNLHRQFVAARSAPPTPAAIVEFVATTLRGSHDQGFAIASVVARVRTGDCSEHAVLTAALARASGIPARVVLGVAIVETEGGYGAYGHAWAETRENGRWRVADAALAASPEPARYVPFGVLEDEGPGYTMGIAALIPSWISRVDVLGAAATR